MRAAPVLDLSPPRVDVYPMLAFGVQEVRVTKLDPMGRRMWTSRTTAHTDELVPFAIRECSRIVTHEVRKQWDLRKAYQLPRRIRRARPR